MSPARRHGDSLVRNLSRWVTRYRSPVLGHPASNLANYLWND